MCGPAGAEPIWTARQAKYPCCSKRAGEILAWNGFFSCTAHIDGKLPAITWKRIPFRQEGDRLTGLYRFTDHFKHQDSVMFSGTLSGRGAGSPCAACNAAGVS